MLFTTTESALRSVPKSMPVRVMKLRAVCGFGRTDWMTGTRKREKGILFRLTA